ncbi:MAG: CBS domain-containing protein [Deltaproteobacteria bacterium]|nr:CBS domain-containing protein [Deltaproteobacteria bacterium]
MRLANVMKTDLVTVARDATIAHARLLMRLNRVSHLPVVDDQKLVGVVSERDIRAPFIRDRENGSSSAIVWFDDLTIGDVMTQSLVTLPADSTIREAASCLRDRRIGCILVVEDARLVGLVTTADLLDLLAGHRQGRTRAPRRRWRHPEGEDPIESQTVEVRSSATSGPVV